jgi:protein gp37
MARKTNIGWMNPRKAGQPISGGAEVEGGTLNSLVGCYPVSTGCENCYAVGECHMKQARKDDLGKEFAGTTEKLPNGLIQFTGKVNFRPEKLHAVLQDRNPRSWFVNSLSDLFYESPVGKLDEKIILEHFDVFSKAYWQEFRALTKRAERMLALDSKINWPSNVRMGVSVESVEYLGRIVTLGKTHAEHKWISFEPWISPWPDDSSKHIRQAFPLTIDGVRYKRLRDLLKACGIECSIVGGESDETLRKPRYCGFDDIHYILDETAEAGAHPCLKQLGTRWAIARNHFRAGGQGAHHGSQKELWPKEFHKYSTEWPTLKLPAYSE